jgi:DNA repair exonuclease SbcCD ATPase subunit
MNNERFMKHYVEVINSTLSESILRTVNLQANAKFVDELVGELNAENENLKLQLQKISEKYNEIINEKNMIEINKQKLDHLETFRSQLIESQKIIEDRDVEIEELKNKVDKLQGSPVTKRKKIGVLNTPVEVDTPVDTTIKDGGTF